MKSYKFLGKATSAFSWDGQDYLIHGTGPHLLPSECELVKSMVEQNLLIPAKSNKKIKTQ
jgi:hypothetical protein